MKIKIVLWISFFCAILAYPLVMNSLAYYHNVTPLDIIKSQAHLSKEVFVKLSEDLKTEEEMLTWGINVKAVGMIQQAKGQRLPLKIDLRSKLNQQFPDFFSKEISFLTQDIEKDRFIMKLNRWSSSRRRLARNKIKLFLPEKYARVNAIRERIIFLEKSIERREKAL